MSLTSLLLPTLVLLTFGSFFVAAADPAPPARAKIDLTKIDRTIAREPVYQAKPKYCLLVFGSEAKTKVWLVLDGNSLYVDRNGTGDLTGPGAKVSMDKEESIEDQALIFKVGEVRDGPRVHKNLVIGVMKLERLADAQPQVKALLAKNPNALGYLASVEMEVPARTRKGVGGRVKQLAFFMDLNGFIQFTDKLREAPIIHFGGPLQITLFGEQQLTLGKETDLVLAVGTPGVGPGTTAYVEYEGVIPDGLYPTGDIVYPPKNPGAAPVREKYELKQRC